MRITLPPADRVPAASARAPLVLDGRVFGFTVDEPGAVAIEMRDPELTVAPVRVSP